MKKLQLYNHQLSLEGEIRTITHGGREHLIVPVIMMVEGVHSGSVGPILYTAEELGSFVEAWNGTAVTVGHPSDEEGDPVSANLPELRGDIVGRIYNTRMDGTRLRSEAHIDIEQLQGLSPETYAMIMARDALEVSIGIFSNELDLSGNFNNEDYRAVAQQIRPDHLALLPNEEGACSWDDGCGVRNNKKQSNEVMKTDLKKLSEPLLKEGFGIHLIVNQLIDNETGFQEIMRNIQRKLDSMDNGIRIHFLEEVFDDDFVYRVRNNETNETSLFQRDYTVQEDGSIEFTTDPVQVRKDVEFVVMKASSKKRERTKFNNKSNKKEKIMDNKTSSCKVDALIANEANKFTEKDKEFLSTLSEEQIDKMTPPEKKEDPIVNKKETKKEEKKEEKKEDLAVMSKEELTKTVKAILSEEKDPEIFINTYMPKGLGEQMKAGLRMHAEKRTKLIKGIVDNSEFKETNLEGWNDNDLQTMHDSVVKEVHNYSGTGANGVSSYTASSVDADELEAMTGVKNEEEN